MRIMRLPAKGFDHRSDFLTLTGHPHLVFSPYLSHAIVRCRAPVGERVRNPGRVAPLRDVPFAIFYLLSAIFYLKIFPPQLFGNGTPDETTVSAVLFMTCALPLAHELRKPQVNTDTTGVTETAGQSALINTHIRVVIRVP